MTNPRDEWLNNLQVGDRVIERGHGGIGSRNTVSTVERFTKTLIVTVSGTRYSRIDGTLFGGSTWNRGCLDEPTEELVDEIRRYNLANQLRHLTFDEWRRMPLGILREIVALLPEKSS